MRRLLLALPFALLPLAVAHAHEDHDHEHGSLGAHEHGVGRLNAVLDGQTLELELESPAMNLVGFEHLATTAAD
ncbi:ZrgA family zinc uptake protein, partial [Pseudomonas poae]